MHKATLSHYSSFSFNKSTKGSVQVTGAGRINCMWALFCTLLRGLQAEGILMVNESHLYSSKYDGIVWRVSLLSVEVCVSTSSYLEVALSTITVGVPHFSS